MVGSCVVNVYAGKRINCNMEEGRVPLESDKWQVASNKFPIQRLGDDTDFDSDLDFDYD